MKGGGEQVAPAKAPKHRPVDAGKDTSQKDRRTRVVSEFGTSGDLMQCAGGNAAAWQSLI